ncbi:MULTISPECIES: hypothetical protein [unclassified Desulfovibrio]|uniref:hypothetical protein n=1 Tax=unclassified Desulfovibrio TaxID=2593640 RepID=UPI000F5D988B|nr:MULTISPECIES: hypothetical protein [unclassified Desulfovibrio]RRD71953.1 hypothetical protein EII24_01875 [Desulfovibrio sp. OH1209_COT-279]RRD88166.1 hypothetical protein EII23_01875 [Desulfovibrio sp. OH1186_COT-070]
MLNRFAACGIFLCFLGLFFGPAAPAVADDPRECVLLAGRALDSADAAGFERAVDMDSLLDQALDVLARTLQQPGAAQDLPPMLAILFAQAARGDGAAAGARALLRAEARAFVVNGIASGAFAGQKPTGRAAQGLLAPLFADASTGRKEVRQVGAARPDGAGWQVPFVLRDWGNGQSYDLVGRVTMTEGQPRLTGLDNMEDLVRRILAEGRDAAL